jgi:hypothetical protein
MMNSYTIIWDYNITVTIRAKSKEEALEIFISQCDWIAEGHQVIELKDVICKNERKINGI